MASLSKRAARLSPLNDSSNIFNFHFELQPDNITHLAPNVFKRRYTSNYAAVPIALSDHAPREFRANNPTELTLEFEIVGAKQLAVERSLKQLRGFLRKDRRTGEPPDMVLVIGDKQWTVRIDTMEHVPRLWNAEANEQRVHVSMNMHTQEWER